MAGFISYTILYAVLIISVSQRTFAQMSTLQTGREGATPSVQDTWPRNYFPHYDAVLTEKIRYDLQYQIPPHTPVIGYSQVEQWAKWCGGNWNATRVVTLMTVTEFIAQTLPPATSTVYVTSLSSKRLRSNREQFAANSGLPSCYVQLYTNSVFLDLAKLEVRS